MTVFVFNIKRLLKRKSIVLTMLILPVIIMLLTVNMRFNRPASKIAIIDKDKTVLTEMLKKELGKNNLIISVDENDIETAVALNKADYAVVIDSGFTDKIINGQAVKLKAYYDKNSNLYKIIDSSLNNYINSLSRKAALAKGNKALFYSSLKQENIVSSSIELGDRNKISIRMTLSFLVMFMLMFSVSNTLVVLKESENYLNYRTFAAPIRIYKYMLQCILSLFVITAFQVAVILTLMVFYYYKSILSEILYLYILFFIFSAVSVAFALFLYTVSKKFNRAGSLSSIIIVPLCMLGGCFWSSNMMPLKLQHISYLVPTTWMINAIDNIIFSGYNLLQLKTYIIILLMFTFVFLLLGMVTKRDIIK